MWPDTLRHRPPGVSDVLLQALAAQELVRHVGRRAPLDLDLGVHPPHRGRGQAAAHAVDHGLQPRPVTAPRGSRRTTYRPPASWPSVVKTAATSTRPSSSAAYWLPIAIGRAFALRRP